MSRYVCYTKYHNNITIHKLYTHLNFVSAKICPWEILMNCIEEMTEVCMPNMAASNPNTHEEETRKIMLE